MSQYHKATTEFRISTDGLSNSIVASNKSSTIDNDLESNILPETQSQSSTICLGPTTFRSSDNSGGRNSTLSRPSVGHSELIVDVVERSKENHQSSGREILDTNQAIAGDTTGDTTQQIPSLAKTWRSGDRAHSNEENSLDTTSLDRVIIESSSSSSKPQLQLRQQQNSNFGDRTTRAIVTGSKSNKTTARLPDDSGAANLLIRTSDNEDLYSLPAQTIAQLANESHSTTTSVAAAATATITTTTTTTTNNNNPADQRRLRFKSLLESVAPSIAPTTATTSTKTTTTCDSGSGELNSLASPPIYSRASGKDQISQCDSYELADGKQEEIQLETLYEEEEYKSDADNDEQHQYTSHEIGQFESYSTSKANSHSKRAAFGIRRSGPRLLAGHTFIRIQRLLGAFNSGFINKETPYVPYEGKDLLTGDAKYPPKRKRHHIGGKTFRGSYKYSRAEISMAIFKKLINLLFQKSTLALIGAFLIHITLGTVYTLSNINSYLTSYMRLHGSPTLTYGGSMWISSFYAVGQGFSMVLGGYLEKRFSARLASFLGCLVHSGSIMGTSWTVNHGSLAVLLSYGFLPGFGCGLAYMTPMSNGFGWFPNRRGLVAGVILAGFGIGTFVFNIAQTAYVNPDNLSPPEQSDGYFTQESILTKVPGLFLFIGSIYAAMQFIGCCLLFRPPSSDYSPGKSPDERPILETEMSVARAVRTREFAVLFLVYGIITQGVLFVNSMIKEYGQLFIGDDMYLAWTGSMASIANALGRLVWGLAIDRYTFTQCFTCITSIFGLLMFLMPFEFVLSSKQLYLVCTLGIFGSFSGWMSTFPVHLSRTFGRLNSGMLYGLIFISQSFGGIASAFGAHYLIDHYSRFVPFFCVVILEILGLAIYHLFYPKHIYL